MKTTIKKTDNCQRQFKLEVPVEQIKVKYDKAYAQLQKTAQVPGFRVGKAPREILQRHFADRVKEEVLSELISENYQSAIEDNGLEPVAYPEVSEIQFEENKPLVFTVKVEVKPEIKLKIYKNIEVKKKAINLTPEEIEKALKLLQENLSLLSPVLEDRELREEDFVLSDIECFVDGSCIDQRQNVLLFLGNKDKNINPAEDNFSQQLLGAKVGQLKKVTMALPKNYSPAKYALRPAEFNISIKQIKEKKLPELNDALAQQAGNYQNLEALKEAVRQDLMKKKELQSKLEVEQQVLGYLLEQNNFAVPDSLVKKRLTYLLEEAEHKLEHQGFSPEDIEKQKGPLEEKLKPEAQKQIRVYFTLNKIAQVEQLKVEPEELEGRCHYLAHLYSKNIEEIKKEINEHNLTQDLEEEILREKTIDFLVKQAKIEIVN